MRVDASIRMKRKKIYYRKKDKSIVIEGKSKGKSILIWTLPDAQIFINRLVEIESFFTKEKCDKINEKLQRLDDKPQKPINLPSKVRLPIIKRTPKEDAIPLTQEEEYRLLRETLAKDLERLDK